MVRATPVFRRLIAEVGDMEVACSPRMALSPRPRSRPRDQLPWERRDLGHLDLTSREAGVAMCTVQSLQSDDATTVTGIPTDRSDGTLPMMVIPPAIGVILILFGIVLFIVDLSVTNHGLPTAGAIITLLAGGLALLGRGVPYSEVLLGALVVVAMLMGGMLFGVLGSLRALKGKPALTGMEGMIGEVSTVRSPVGVDSSGWVFVHGERWRAVLAFAPEEIDPRDGEPMLGVGSRVRVVGFGEGGEVQVVAVDRTYYSRSLDMKG
jgi:membrane protein implicated in regulation of membrane protease activity